MNKETDLDTGARAARSGNHRRSPTSSRAERVQRLTCSRREWSQLRCLAIALLYAACLCSCTQGVEFDSAILGPRAGSDGTAGDAGETVHADAGAYQAADSADLSIGQPFSGPETCADVRVVPDRVIPTVAFLLDGSGSMKCAYPAEPGCDCESQLRGKCQPSGNDTRWQALQAALLDTEQKQGADGVFKALQEAVRFGMVIYNNHPDDARCPAYPVNVSADLNRYRALRDAFPEEPPGFNTPTGPALDAVVRAMPDPDQARNRGLGPQIIVLATDGQPFECTFDIAAAPDLDYETVLDAADLAASKSIAIYVVSLAEATGDFADHLHDVAKRGQTSRAYLPADRDGLIADLDAIISDAISCQATVNGEIELGRECEGTVTLGGDELDCDGADGFRLLDPHTLELVGAACDRFKSDAGATLEALFPCEVYSVD